MSGKLKEPNVDQTQQNVDNPQDNNDSDDDEDDATDFEIEEGISHHVFLQ